jgi:cellulose synthase/poly-beta-1,6-N-acetylglucosamine synthase-like glycosyltransferase
MSMFFFFALLGILGMTWMFPLLAIATSRSGRFRSLRGENLFSSFEKSAVPESRISIVVPAHNEEHQLGSTLKSVRDAIGEATAKFPQVNFSIVVGVDGCSDNSENIAMSEGALCLVNENSLGKWKTLLRLVFFEKGSDWIIFVDAGTIWPKDLLVRTLPIAFCYGVIGVAPTYTNPKGGVCEKLLWGFERHMKGLESHLGGPVTIHGATVLYRTKELLEALKVLGTEDWINDDVALPLMLRALNPEKQIVYLPNLGVRDGGLPRQVTHLVTPEYYRRKRMVVGNLQCLRRLLTSAWRRNGVAGALFMRRVFRVFWAYWALLSFLAVLSVVERFFGVTSSMLVGFGGSLGVIFLLVILPSLRKFLDAGLASLLAPYYLFLLVKEDAATKRPVWR